MSQADSPSAKRSIRMLIVDDDADIRSALKDYFELQGLSVTLSADGVEAIDRLQGTPLFDVVLLDIMLPKRSGFDVLREAQKRNVHTPIIVLSARSEVDMIEKGLSFGAVEYVTKPFDAEELSARVRAVLSRTMPSSEAPMDVYQMGSLKVNFSTYEVKRDGERVDFSETDFALLQVLLLTRGRTLSAEDISAELARSEAPPLPPPDVPAALRHLASKLEPDPSAPRYILQSGEDNFRFNAQ